MTPERWARVKTIFASAMEVEPASREAYVRHVSNGDSELYAEVVSLLQHQSNGTLFRDPLLAPGANPPAVGAVVDTLIRHRTGFRTPTGPPLTAWTRYLHATQAQPARRMPIRRAKLSD